MCGDVAQVVTTAGTSGMPCFDRIASAWRSGSPGIRGPFAAAAGLVARNTRIHSSICRLNSSGSMNPSIRSAPKKWPIPLADAAGRDFLAQRERRHERSPVCPAQDGRENIDHCREAITLVAAVRAVAAQRQERTALDHFARIVGDRAGPVDGPAVLERQTRCDRRSRSCRRRPRSWPCRSRSAVPRGRETRSRSGSCPASARRPRAGRPACSSWSSPSRSSRV